MEFNDHYNQIYPLLKFHPLLIWHKGYSPSTPFLAQNKQQT